jgi:hypothetical protein
VTGKVELFNRRAQTIVAPVDGSEGIDVTGLRTVFRVEKTSTSEPNTATVEVYNLSPFSRNRIESKDQVVTLRAGYVDQAEQVILGVVRRVEHPQGRRRHRHRARDKRRCARPPGARVPAGVRTWNRSHENH